jgi:hypothetical protein
MVRRPKDNRRRKGRRAVSAALLALFLTAFSFVLPQIGWGEEKDYVLPESGIHYPGGFDTNTIGEVRGKASDPVFPATGPVQFRLVSDRDTYIVLASPKWYWSDLRVHFPEGTPVRVRGSKTLGKDGKLYIIAQEIQVLPEGKSVALRGEDGYPLWKGAASGTMGGHGGAGPSSGGMGSGFGGMGRGKR